MPTQLHKVGCSLVSDRVILQIDWMSCILQPCANLLYKATNVTKLDQPSALSSWVGAPQRRGTRHSRESCILTTCEVGEGQFFTDAKMTEAGVRPPNQGTGRPSRRQSRNRTYRRYLGMQDATSRSFPLAFDVAEESWPLKGPDQIDPPSILHRLSSSERQD